MNVSKNLQLFLIQVVNLGLNEGLDDANQGVLDMSDQMSYPG